MEVKEYIAEQSHKAEWSGLRIIFELANEYPNMVNLGMGEPDFDTPQFIIDAAKTALDEGYTRYAALWGDEELRAAIALKLKRENNLAVDPATDIFVSIGAMQGIFNNMLHLINPGDEVLIADPGYDYYYSDQSFWGHSCPGSCICGEPDSN